MAMAMAATATAVVASPPPNFIVLFADDMGYGDLPFTGHPTIRAPHIERLAREGTRFTQWLSGAPICTPSRAALLTGRLPLRTGVYTDHGYPLGDLFRVFYPVSTGGLPAYELTIPKVLRTRGYRSKLIGKWHLGHFNGSLPTEAGGFDEFYGLPYSQDEGCPPGVGMPCRSRRERWVFPPTPLYNQTRIIEQPVNLQNAAPPVEPLVPRYTAAALDFMRRMAAARTPFFLELAYDEVHVPLFAAPAFRNASARGLFGDAVAEMDASIGAVMDHVRATPALADNTLVVFTSDNGPWLVQAVDGGSAGLFRGGKGSTWEGGVREPAVAWWPGRVAANALNQRDVASSMDVLPTFAELAGARLPHDRHYDGVSLRAALLGGDGGGDGGERERPMHRESYFYYRDAQLFAVRYRQYKAHFLTRSGFGIDPPLAHDPPMLFDVERDPSEAHPLDPAAHADVLAAVARVVAAHRKTVATLPPPQLNHIDLEVYPCCNHVTECVCAPQPSS